MAGFLQLYLIQINTVFAIVLAAPSCSSLFTDDICLHACIDLRVTVLIGQKHYKQTIPQFIQTPSVLTTLN